MTRAIYVAVAVSMLIGGVAANPALSDDFFLNAKAERGPVGEIQISGSTNLPEGMKMQVVVGSERKSQVSDDVLVHGEEFRTAYLFFKKPNPHFTQEMRRWPDADSLKFRERPFPAGQYKVKFFAVFNGAWQGGNVLELVGEGGKNLHGKLFKETDPDVIDSDKELDTTLVLSFPPISREAEAISLVKSSVLTVPGQGRSATDIEANLALYMLPKIGLTGKGWSAKANGDKTYEVVFTFINGNLGEQQAIWSANLATKKVKYVNAHAKMFSWTPNY